MLQSTLDGLRCDILPPTLCRVSFVEPSAWLSDGVHCVAVTYDLATGPAFLEHLLPSLHHDRFNTQRLPAPPRLSVAVASVHITHCW